MNVKYNILIISISDEPTRCEVFECEDGQSVSTQARIKLEDACAECINEAVGSYPEDAGECEFIVYDGSKIRKQWTDYKKPKGGVITSCRLDGLYGCFFSGKIIETSLQAEFPDEEILYKIGGL